MFKQSLLGLRTHSAVVGVFITLIVLLLLVAVAWVVRSNAPREGADPGVDVVDVLDNDPALAAASIVSAVNSYVPGEDESPADGAKRVEDRLSGKYAQYARDENVPLPDMWQSWAKAGDRIHAIAEPFEDYSPPKADALSTTVPLHLKIMVWHPDGEFTPLRSGDVEAYMVREAGVWKLSDLEYTKVNA